MDVIDLRSDTVTKPIPEMYSAIAQAPLGDDVYSEDPTVNEFEELAAEMTGKEAALFIPSGTMGNLTSVLAHTNHGDEVLIGNNNHIKEYEAGGISAIAGCIIRTLPSHENGEFILEEVEKNIRGENIHHAPQRLICMENTHLRAGGFPQTVEYTKKLGDIAHNHGLKLHIDGARIFNAATALGVDIRDLTAPADSVMFCISKGLCSPVGSVVVGTKDFIQRARRKRKILGGGMRQAGILAACGLVSLKVMTKRLHEDHACAYKLAEGLHELPGFTIDPDKVKTNIVFFEFNLGSFDAVAFTTICRKKGVLFSHFHGSLCRMVTHWGINETHIDTVLSIISRIIRKRSV